MFEEDRDNPRNVELSLHEPSIPDALLHDEVIFHSEYLQLTLCHTTFHWIIFREYYLLFTLFNIQKYEFDKKLNEHD